MEEYEKFKKLRSIESTLHDKNIELELAEQHVYAKKDELEKLGEAIKNTYKNVVIIRENSVAHTRRYTRFASITSDKFIELLQKEGIYDPLVDKRARELAEEKFNNISKPKSKPWVSVLVAFCTGLASGAFII